MLKKISFFLDFIFDGDLCSGYIKNPTNTLSSEDLVVFSKAKKTPNLPPVFSIYDIPNYLKLSTKDSEQKVKTLKAPLYNGFLINLQNYENLDSYLSKKLGRSRKSQLKRYKKRLDHCFAPEYKIFCGHITKAEYDSLFSALERLIIKRFKQKEEINFEIPYLKTYKKIMFELILRQKASIFAIYHSERPISITLNFIQNHTLFHWNSCYDIDYSMFNLGHVNMLNHLDWSFSNGIKIFDMGRGDFYHKRKYVDTTYKYEEMFVSVSAGVKSSIRFYLNFFIVLCRYYLITCLKKINAQKIYSFYSKLIYRVLKKPSMTKENNIASYNLISHLPEQKYLRSVEYFKVDSRLTKSVNKFIFDKRLKENNIDIYVYNKQSNTYFLKSDKFYAKINVKC